MKWIKKSIKQFKKSHCENLVLDIRGNTGGDDKNWYPYLLLLSDHNALEPNSEYRNTPQNIAKVKEMKWPIAGVLEKESKMYPDAEFIRGGLYARIHVRKVDKHVHRAAVIIDNHVGSSGEGLLLALKAYSGRRAGARRSRHASSGVPWWADRR